LEDPDLLFSTRPWVEDKPSPPSLRSTSQSCPSDICQASAVFSRAVKSVPPRWIIFLTAGRLAFYWISPTRCFFQRTQRPFPSLSRYAPFPRAPPPALPGDLLFWFTLRSFFPWERSLFFFFGLRSSSHIKAPGFLPPLSAGIIGVDCRFEGKGSGAEQAGPMFMLFIFPPPFSPCSFWTGLLPSYLPRPSAPSLLILKLAQAGVGIFLLFSLGSFLPTFSWCLRHGFLS